MNEQCYLYNNYFISFISMLLWFAFEELRGIDIQFVSLRANAVYYTIENSYDICIVDSYKILLYLMVPLVDINAE